MKIAFLFAGQGQQFLNMGKDLCENYPVCASYYQKAQDILEMDLLNLDLETLNQTQYTQTALYVLGCAIGALLEEKGIIPEVVGGLSLGEYNALEIAKVFTFEEGLNIVSARGKIMQEALPSGYSKMAAVLKTDTDQVERLIQDLPVEICNYNTPSQTIIGGTTEQVDEAILTLKDAGIRFIVPLKVSVVSHHPLLKEASIALKEELAKHSFHSPQYPFINNIEAKYQTDNFVNSLSNHIIKPTQFKNMIEQMKQDGIDTYIEIGPKNTLSKFVKEIDPNATTYNVYDMQTLGDLPL